ncbi:MAG: dTDP-4-dehydrorhamnose 3,5-epimerase family protein [Deltaproteobacteria bacterium]|nr:dTDP-4-dehydrorhamnose 3,5-epimerase family protein [Deltaproteobacteria bacterium]
MTTFIDADIKDVLIRPLKRYSDGRGWLMELFRSDELEGEYLPVMTYVSLTRPGVARGPHEHVEQADYFCFIGPSDFKVYLWDNRGSSLTRNHKMVFIAGESSPSIVIVPKGIVHAYKNVGNNDGVVINCPNRLFKGKDRCEAVDEIRHEEDAASPYKLD